MSVGSEVESERIEYHNNTVLSVACCTEDHTVLSGNVFRTTLEVYLTFGDSNDGKISLLILFHLSDL